MSMDGKAKHFGEITNNRMKGIFKIHSESQTTNSISYTPQEDGLDNALWRPLLEFLDKFLYPSLKQTKQKKIQNAQRV